MKAPTTMNSGGEIIFDRAAAPHLHEGVLLFPAALDGRPLRVGIATDALLRIWADAPTTVDFSRLTAFSPVIRSARTLVADKFGRDGVDERGEVIVREDDLSS